MNRILRHNFQIILEEFLELLNQDDDIDINEVKDCIDRLNQVNLLLRKVDE